MKNRRTVTWSFVLISTLIFMIVGMPLQGFAYGAEQQLCIVVDYTDVWEGYPQQVQAQYIGYEGYEQAYWVQLPGGTDLNTLTLSVYDPTGTYVSFMPADGDTLWNVYDSGSSLETAVPVVITAYQMDDSWGTQIMLYISTESGVPSPEAIVSWPVQVTVHYVSDEGYEIASSTTQDIYTEGYTTVYAQPYGLPEGYSLSGSDSQEIYADQQGNLSQNDVYFTYSYAVPVEWPRPVTVHYTDENGWSIAADTIEYVNEGETAVYPRPTDLPENYVLTSADVQYVNADHDGNVWPGEVIFSYMYVSPVEWPRPVTVHYTDENGWSIAADTVAYVNEGENAVYPQPTDLPDNYELTSADVQYVNADHEGNVWPGEVTFGYMYVAPVEWPRPVTVHYTDESGWSIAADTVAYVNEGETAVYPQPTDLPDNYELTSADVQYVNADHEGNVWPGEVTFGYMYVAPVEWPRPVTVHYTDENGWSIAADTVAYVNEGETAVYPQPNDLPENYVLTSADVQYVNADHDGNVWPGEVTFGYMYIAPVEWPRPVTVHYTDENGWNIAEDTIAYVNEGETAVYPQPTDLPENYVLTSADVQYVNADHDGNVLPGEVTFGYMYVAPVEWPRPVTVHYTDESGWSIAADTVAYVNEGETAVYPQPNDLPENYELTSANVQYVNADHEGNVWPGEVTFSYMYVAPVEWPRPVTVHYHDEYGSSIASDTVEFVNEGENTVHPQPTDLPENYFLLSDDTVAVRADGEGNVTPEEVTFVFTYVAPVEWPKWVTVHYLSMNGSPVAEDTLYKVENAGIFTIEPEPSELLVNYELSELVISETVTADENGNLDKTEVSFYYDYVPPVEWPRKVTIHYVSDTGESIAPDTDAEVIEGFNTVCPGSEQIPENYVLIGDDEIQITAYSDGMLSKEEVTFTYAYAEPVKWPKSVTVHYCSVENEGQNVIPVATDTWAEVFEGDNVILPDPADLGPFYEPAEENDSVTVYADALGNLSLTEVTFYYVYKEPVIWPLYVTVHYISDDGQMSVAADQSREVNQGNNQIWASPEDLMEDYSLTGDECFTVYADADGTVSPAEVTFRYYHIETKKQTEWPVSIPVYCFFEESDQKIADDYVEWIKQGENVVIPRVIDGYICNEESVTVTGYEDGSISQSEIVFLYFEDISVQPTEEIIIAPVPVSVIYRTNDGTKVASTGTVFCTEGRNEIYCDPVDLKSGYVLNDDDVKYVYVDMNGVNAYEVVFEYIAVAEDQSTGIPETTPEPTPEFTPVPEDTPSPVPDVKLIRIEYVNGDTNEIFLTDNVPCTIGVSSPIYADLQRARNVLGNDYDISSENPVVVDIDSKGNCSPDAARFYFTSRKMIVTVYYCDENGRDVAAPRQIECYEGENTVVADPIDLIENYELDTLKNGNTKKVYCVEGTVNPSSITFIYKEESLRTEQMDTYAQPLTDAIRVMSEPVMSGDRQIATVTRNDVLHVTQRVINKEGQIWYGIESVGLNGYVNEAWIRFMSEDEIIKYLATPVPQMPDGPVSQSGEVINLWGTAKSQVNFRSEPTTGSKKLESLESGNKIWIMEEVNASDGDSKWYHAIYKNKEGYVSAKYIKLMSKEKSDEQQSKLKSPAPEMYVYNTPAPTFIPTFTPMPTPQETPVLLYTEVPATPAPTPVPDLYTGYALTACDVLLRSDDNENGNFLPPTTLVLITGQNWVDGQLWDYVDVQGWGMEGYVPDEYTYHISDEDAKNQLKRVQPTAVPTPVPQQRFGLHKTINMDTPCHEYPDEQSWIADMLGQGTAVCIIQQEFPNGVEWDFVQYGNRYGYIRGDQLIEMSEDEVQGYYSTITTPTPSPLPANVIPTPDPDPVSCYGYVLCGDVLSIRERPSQNATQVTLLGNYSLLMITGSEFDSANEEWYSVIVAEDNNAKSGYAKANYVQRLRTSEVNRFLNSNEYINAHSNIEPVQEGYLISHEDYNYNYNNSSRQNNGTMPTYAPYQPQVISNQDEFENDYTDDADPANSPVYIPEYTPTAEASPTIVPFSFMGNEGDDSPVPFGGNGKNDTGTMKDPDANSGDEASDNNKKWLVVIGAILIVAAAGAAYGYSIHVRNEKRRAAIRASQAKKQRDIAKSPAAAGTASAANTRTYPAGTRSSAVNAPYATSQRSSAPGSMPGAGTPSGTQPAAVSSTSNAQNAASAAKRSVSETQNAGYAVKGDYYVRPRTADPSPVNSTVHKAAETVRMTAAPAATSGMNPQPKATAQYPNAAETQRIQNVKSDTKPAEQGTETVRRRRSDTFKDDDV